MERPRRAATAAPRLPRLLIATTPVVRPPSCSTRGEADSPGPVHSLPASPREEPSPPVEAAVSPQERQQRDLRALGVDVDGYRRDLRRRWLSIDVDQRHMQRLSVAGDASGVRRLEAHRHRRSQLTAFGWKVRAEAEEQARSGNPPPAPPPVATSWVAASGSGATPWAGGVVRAGSNLKGRYGAMLAAQQQELDTTVQGTVVGEARARMKTVRTPTAEELLLSYRAR